MDSNDRPLVTRRGGSHLDVYEAATEDLDENLLARVVRNGQSQFKIELFQGWAQLTRADQPNAETWRQLPEGFGREEQAVEFLAARYREAS